MRLQGKTAYMANFSQKSNDRIYVVFVFWCNAPYRYLIIIINFYYCRCFAVAMKTKKTQISPCDDIIPIEIHSFSKFSANATVIRISFVSIWTFNETRDWRANIRRRRPHPSCRQDTQTICLCRAADWTVYVCLERGKNRFTAVRLSRWVRSLSGRPIDICRNHQHFAPHDSPHIVHVLSMSRAFTFSASRRPQSITKFLM